MSYLGQCNVKTAQKVRGLKGGFVPKTFQGLNFIYSGHLNGQYIFGLFARETNLKKKHSVILT